MILDIIAIIFIFFVKINKFVRRICSFNSFPHKTNVVGTLNMLGLAKRVGARFLLTSTSEVYGDPLQHPQLETYWGNVNPIGTPPLSLTNRHKVENLKFDG